jgi:hypothetical protein
LRLAERAWPLLLAAVALAAAALVATPLLVQLLGWQRAVWVSFTTAWPGDAVVRLETSRGAERLPVLWDPKGSANFAAILADAPLVLESARADGRALDLGKARKDTRWKAEGEALNVPVGGLLELPQAPTSLELRLRSSAATPVTIRWRELEAKAALQPGRSEVVRLSTDGRRTGWVLLPPRRIASTALEWGAPQPPDLQVRVHDGGAKAIEPSLAALAGLNEIGIAARAGVFIVVLLIGALLLLAGTAALRRLPPSQAPPVPTNDLVPTLITVGAVSLAFQAFILFAVPFEYTPDSRSYYSMARAFLAGQGLEAAHSNRVFGYPAILALTIRLFGDQLWAIMVLQHLALAAIGPMVAAFLHPRLGRLYALAFGALAGCSPWLAITGNVLWTEALFAFLSAAATLVLAPAAGLRTLSLRRALLGGVLLGIAVTVRANAVFLIAAVVLVLAMAWWIGPRSARDLRAAAGRAAIVAVCGLLFVSPWVMELRKRDGAFPAIALFGSLEKPGHVLEPTSMNLNQWFYPMFHQHRVDPALDVQAPFRAFGAGWTLDQGFQMPDGIADEIYYDSRYPGEAVRQVLRADPLRALTLAAKSFYYNTAYAPVPGGAPEVVFSDMIGLYSEQLMRPRSEAPLPDRGKLLEAIANDLRDAKPPYWRTTPERHERIASLLHSFTEPTHAAGSVKPVDRALRASIKMRKAQVLFSALALVALLGIALSPRHREALVPWLYVFGSIAYLSLAAHGNERFTAPFEPLIYLLSAYGVWTLLNLPALVRRDGTIRPREIKEPH